MRRLFGFVAVFIAAAIPVLWASPSLAASGQTAISGVVYNAASGAPVAGAKLTLTGGGGTYSTTSDANGTFSFDNISAGTWSVRTTAPLYTLSVSPAIVVAAGQTVDISVALQPVTSTDITTLGHVTVRGHQTLNTTSAAAVTISASQYVNTGTLQVQQLLETTPGISIEHFDNGAPGNVATFSIRGAGGFVGGSNTGYELLVLQDGEPIRNGQFGDADLSALTPSIYSRVEVVKGVGGTSLFGANTVGGTLNLVTIDPKATEGAEAQYTVGTYGTSDYNLSDTNTYGRLGYVLDYHQYSTEGYIPSNYRVDTASCFNCSTPPTGFVTNPTEGMLLRSGLGKIRYAFSNASFAVLTATDEADWRDQFGLLGNPSPIFLSSGQQVNNDPQGNPYWFGFPLNYVWNTNPKYTADLHTTVGGGAIIARYYDNWINRWVDGNTLPDPSMCCFLQKSVDHITGESLSFDRVIGNQDVLVALGGNSDRFDYGQCFFGTPICHASDINGSTGPFTTGAQIERTALLRDDDQLNAKLNVTFAGYYSSYNDLNVKRFDPRLAFVDRPDESSALRFSVGTGFAAPRLSDLVTPLNLSSPDFGPNCPFTEFRCNASSGNPNVKGEDATGYDLGYERTWGATGDFSVDLYRTDLHNHIYDALLPAPAGLKFSNGSPVLGIDEPLNLAGSIYQGIELAGAEPIADTLTLKAYYNTQAAYPVNVDLETEQALGNVVDNQQYEGIPLHKAGWTLNFLNKDRWSGFFGADWFAKNNSYNVAPFWVYNMGATLPLNASSSVHLAWHNVFNADGIIFSQFDQGVPYPSAPGANTTSNGCSQGAPGFCNTTAYSYAPHSFSVTFDTRIGSLR